MRIMILSIWLLIGFASGAGAEGSKEIRIGGGGASCKAYFSAIRDLFEAETGVHLVINPTTPIQGLIELNNGQIDLVAAPVPFATLVKGAARNGVIIDSGLFTVRNIGRSNIQVFVNKVNGVASLNKKQLQDIFTGKMRNWRQAGGEDREIVVVWGVATPGQNELFNRQILDGKPVTASAMEVFDYDEIRETIARIPGAIGIDPHGYISSSIKSLKTPAVVSDVIAVTKGQPKPEVERLLGFIKEYSW